MLGNVLSVEEPLLASKLLVLVQSTAVVTYKSGITVGTPRASTLKTNGFPENTAANPLSHLCTSVAHYMACYSLTPAPDRGGAHMSHFVFFEDGTS